MKSFKKSRRWIQLWLFGFIVLLTSLIASLIISDTIYIGLIIMFAFVIMILASCIPSAHSVGIRDVYDDSAGGSRR